VQSYSWTPPAGTVSGFFIAKLTKLSGGDIGKQSYMIFVVRDDSRTSDFLFQSAVTTYQAYNTYPGPIPDTTGWRTGRSLYPVAYGNTLPGSFPGQSAEDRQGREVSFNRPYFEATNPTEPEAKAIYSSAGQFFEFEYNMVRWMEREGYDVTYQTDIDTHELPATLAPGKHKAFLSVGHDEYWTWKMRRNVEVARDDPDNPTKLAFFGGNTAQWQIRLKPSSSTSIPANADNRTIICYKQHWRDLGTTPGVGDPNFKNNALGVMNDNYTITTVWRDNQNTDVTGCTNDPSPDCNCPSGTPNCTRKPEDELIGVMTKLGPVKTVQHVSGQNHRVYIVTKRFPDAKTISLGLPEIVHAV